MPEVPEELDVFRLPHGHMKQLVKDMDKEVCTCILNVHRLFNSLLAVNRRSICV